MEHEREATELSDGSTGLERREVKDEEDSFLVMIRAATTTPLVDHKKPS